MSSDQDDAALRKQRADEIRRLRDQRNAGITSDESPPADPGSDDEPNYVDLIDREMRRDRE